MCMTLPAYSCKNNTVFLFRQKRTAVRGRNQGHMDSYDSCDSYEL